VTNPYLNVLSTFLLGLYARDSILSYGGVSGNLGAVNNQVAKEMKAYGGLEN